MVLFPIWGTTVFTEYEIQLDVFIYDTLFPCKEIDTLFGL